LTQVAILTLVGVPCPKIVENVKTQTIKGW